MKYVSITTTYFYDLSLLVVLPCAQDAKTSQNLNSKCKLRKM